MRGSHKVTTALGNTVASLIKEFAILYTVWIDLEIINKIVEPILISASLLRHAINKRGVLVQYMILSNAAILSQTQLLTLVSEHHEIRRDALLSTLRELATSRDEKLVRSWAVFNTLKGFHQNFFKPVVELRSAAVALRAANELPNSVVKNILRIRRAAV